MWDCTMSQYTVCNLICILKITIIKRLRTQDGKDQGLQPGHTCNLLALVNLWNHCANSE